MAVLAKRPIRRELMVQQRKAYCWVRDNKVRHVPLFMEMRLGKTLTAIRLVTDLWQLQGPCMVAAPVSVLNAWEKELERERELYTVAHGLTVEQRIEQVRKVQFAGMRAWLLINYEALRLTPGITQMHWDFAGLDESTAIKNPKTTISQLCCAGFRDVDHRMLLTGLPSPEGELNLFQQFKFLDGHFMGHKNFFNFRAENFVPSGFSGWEPDWKKQTGARIKKSVHLRAFIMRRQDAGMANRKVRERRSVKMEKEQLKVYKELEADFATWVDQGDGTEVLRETQHVVVQRTWMARIAGGCDADGVHRWPAKNKEVISLLKGELALQPVVIWFRFNSELHALKEALQKAGISCRSLTGDDDRDARTRNQDWFTESKDKGRVLLVQVKLGKYSLDLSVADTAIYYSCSYSCEEMAQSEDRIVHPLKNLPLLYVYLETKDTIDEDIVTAAMDKITDAKSFMINIRKAFMKRKGLAT